MPNDIVVLSFLVAAALACFVGSAVALWGSRDKAAGRIVGLSTFCVAAWNAQLAFQSFPSAASEYPSLLVFLRSFGFVLPAVVLHSVVTLAEAPKSTWKGIVIFGYAIAALVCVLNSSGLMVDGLIVYEWGAMSRPGRFMWAFVAFVLVYFPLTFFAAMNGLRNADTAESRLRMKYLLLGIGPAMALGAVNFLPSYGVSMPPTGSVGALLFVGAMAYATVRHRLLDLDILVIRGGGVAFALLLVALPLAVLVIWGQGQILGDPKPLTAITSIGAMLIAMPIYLRLRQFLDGQVERSLFPSRHEARRAIEKFSRDIISLTEREGLGGRLVESLVTGLGLIGAALYVRSDGKHYLRDAVCGDIEAPEWVVADSAGTPRGGVRDVPNWELCLPLGSEGDMLGFIALGPKRSGGAIDDLDTTLLNVVASQVAVALRNIDTLRQVEVQKEAIESQRDSIERQRAEIEELQARVQAENTVLRKEVRSISGFDRILGSSPALREVLALVDRIAPSDLSVLITGETGTGKELIARALHAHSRRAEGPLISVNCPAIPAALAEAELFGSERGAYTGAVEARLGSFELADGGTLFLDEVAELPLAVQVKLLRVLQEHEVQRLGSGRARKIDVRLVAATNRDLHELANAGLFRMDLYHRLAGVVAKVPPLRQRIIDIEILAPYFLERATRANQKSVTGISNAALRLLLSYSWPGNVRELQNVIERAVLLCDGALIAPEHLGDLSVTHSEETPLALAVRDEKARRIEEALEASGGNQAEAARRLGVAPSNLGRMIRRMGLKTPRSLQ